MTSKGTILVVDDDRLVLATLAHGLTQAGYAVIDADNGDDAILLSREHRPDLALLDIRMEGKSGFDVAAYLRESCRIPFIFLSAFADSDTVKQVRALGALDYLVKPLDIGQIVPAVEAAFGHIEASRSEAAAAVASTARVDAVWLDAPVAIAVGILMHRFSLGRLAALERLQRLAEAEARSVPDHAERLIQALELFSTPLSGGAEGDVAVPPA